MHKKLAERGQGPTAWSIYTYGLFPTRYSDFTWSIIMSRFFGMSVNIHGLFPTRYSDLCIPGDVALFRPTWFHYELCMFVQVRPWIRPKANKGIPSLSNQKYYHEKQNVFHYFLSLLIPFFSFFFFLYVIKFSSPVKGIENPANLGDQLL